MNRFSHTRALVDLSIWENIIFPKIKKQNWTPKVNFI